MSTRRGIQCLLAGLLCLSTQASPAADFNQQLHSLRQEWAVATHERDGDGKGERAALAKLHTQAEALQQAYPFRAEAWVWDGVILMSQAKAIGGPKALSYVKRARKQFEHSLEIEPAALRGLAYSRLGILYAKVPGWPIGFGDSGKARESFNKALSLDPDDLEVNYLYGQYLIEQGKYRQAVPVLQRALGAVPASARTVFQKKRKADIAKALARARAKV